MIKRRRNKRNYFVLIVVILCAFTCYAICFVSGWFISLLWEQGLERQVNCATFDARPISGNIVDQLCSSNLVPTSLGTCPNVLLQRNDIGTIVSENILVGESIYADVYADFGRYEVYCAVPSVDRPNYRCTYDVTGRGPNINVFYNNSTNMVESVRITSCN